VKSCTPHRAQTEHDGGHHRARGVVAARLVRPPAAKRPLKNAIDRLSRPVSDIPRIFGGRIVGVIGASPGRFGTLSAQQA
jgi:hypothetical protein